MEKPYYDVAYFIKNDLKLSDIDEDELIDAFLERRMHYMIVDVAITEELIKKADASKLLDAWRDLNATSIMHKWIEYALKQAIK